MQRTSYKKEEPKLIPKHFLLVKTLEHKLRCKTRPFQYCYALWFSCGAHRWFMVIRGRISTATTREKERERISFKRYLHWKVYWSGLYLGFVVWGRSPEWAKGVRVHDPRKCFESNMKYALRCNLVHFETVLRNVTVCALPLSRLDDFFRYSYSHTVMMTIFFGGGSWAFWGKAFTSSSNIRDRTLLVVQMFRIWTPKGWIVFQL